MTVKDLIETLQKVQQKEAGVLFRSAKEETGTFEIDRVLINHDLTNDEVYVILEEDDWK